jgi:hypothetical protein
MGDNNSTFQGHPFYVALSIFNAAMRTPLNIAAAFWRPRFTEDWNQKVRTAQDTEGHEVEISLPKTENQLAAIAQSGQCRRKSLTPLSASTKHRSRQ